MKQAKNLANYRSLRVEVKRKADEELLKHLHRTILGSPGGIQYTQTNIERKLSSIPEIYFILLKKSGKLLGSVGFVRRISLVAGVPLKTWYIRYFSVNAPLRTRKVKPVKEKSDAVRGLGLLKGAVMPYFENPGKLESSSSPETEKSLIYAFIERGNLRSSSFSETMGLKPYREFTTVLFSRVFFKKDKNVEHALSSDKNEILSALDSFYSGYNLYTSANICPGENYLIYKQNGKIVAGLQVHPDAWKIHNMKSWPWFFLKFLPSIPGVRKIFNPKDFRFLGIEGIFYSHEGKKHLQTLLETACAIFQTSIAMIWLDTESLMMKDLKENVRLGIMDKMMKTVRADAYLRLIGMNEAEDQTFQEKPVYISAFDMI